MFDCLLGRKLSKKCKHSVKCIRYRMVTIRKKQQAVVRYLKKDVADLIAGGYETNAFGRMDGLIVEINLASCYDMIEQYCGCILENLSRLRKDRECPNEAKEAVATLIFAAARLSNLPELADLRHVFSERYGTRLESFVNKEFVEKSHKKSFTKDKKLMFMKDISLEFAVSWNSIAFQSKILNQPAPSDEKNMNHTEESSKQPRVPEEDLNDKKRAITKVENEGTGCNEQCEPSPRIVMLLQNSQQGETTDVGVIKEEHQNAIQIASQEQRTKNSLHKHQVQPKEQLDIPRIPNFSKICTDDASKKMKVNPDDLSNINPEHNYRKLPQPIAAVASIDSKAIDSIGNNADQMDPERRLNKTVNAKSCRTINPKPPYSKAKISVDGYPKPPYVKNVVSKTPNYPAHERSNNLLKNVIFEPKDAAFHHGYPTSRTPDCRRRKEIRPAFLAVGDDDSYKNEEISEELLMCEAIQPEIKDKPRSKLLLI
ncbi:hypothetical protein HPP92_017326 [Vanilla planifolia]|uniref:IST1-like protein n=1 Tax=Vanilla planifolia TaxID=51239 RepID=A0A835QGU6_VANPL|nr:hypothetical protein HPP92_017326 [Vanilla planifolia]